MSQNSAPPTEYVVIVKASDPPNVKDIYTIKESAYDKVKSTLDEADSGVKKAKLPEDLDNIIEAVVTAVNSSSLPPRGPRDLDTMSSEDMRAELTKLRVDFSGAPGRDELKALLTKARGAVASGAAEARDKGGGTRRTKRKGGNKRRTKSKRSKSRRR